MKSVTRPMTLPKPPARRLVCVSPLASIVPLAAAVAASLLLASCAGSVVQPSSAELIRTEGGVVHISAPDFASLGYGMAYAYAEDNICMLADHLLTVRGERSKYFGPDLPATPSVHGEYSAQVQYTPGFVNEQSDFFYRAYLDSAALERSEEALSPDARALLGGYVAGYNRYLAQHARSLPAACHDAAWVKPMTPDDMRRLIAEKAIHATGEYFRAAVLAAQPPAAPSPEPSAPHAGNPPAQSPGEAREAWIAGLASHDLGSNALAIGSALSQDGRGLLLGNPHFPWFGPDRFYEAHLTVPGRYDAMGATLGGLPVIVIGFNRDIAWTHTVTTARHFALLRLALDPADPTHMRYRIDGSWASMVRKLVSIDVRQADGTLVKRQRAFYTTPLGAVIAAPSLGLKWDAQHAYVLSDMNRSNLRMIDQWLAIGAARRVDDIAQAEQRYSAMPWVNTIAADRSGATLFEDYSTVPNIAHAALTQGCLLDPRLFVLDGARAACGANAGPDGIFAQHVAQMRHPRLERSDYVANSNDSYWLANPAAPVTGLLPVFGSENSAQSLRTRFAWTRIEARAQGRDGQPGTRFDTAALERLMFDSDVYAAQLLKPQIVATCEAAHPAGDVAQACAVLARWDGRADAASRGAPLFRLVWARLAHADSLWAVPFDRNAPMATPRGLNPAASDAVMAALRDAAADMRTAQMPLDAALANFQYSTLRNERIALDGGPGEDGLYNVVSSGTRFDRRPFGEIESGSSYIQLVGFDANGPVAQALLTYGQATDTQSPWFGDQIRRFAAHQWIALPYAGADVLAHAQGPVVHLAY
ncbi:penicillin acylase family protein [Paraburkholderia bannensis]|uniref:penicillin acylase family protein n=1 Tax=Paraburkholderia bannensis TaxID=765414 RepID=UPI002AB7559A|nr:penicillin acylase family protein [Paraburkholderia bannensis]